MEPSELRVEGIRKPKLIHEVMTPTPHSIASEQSLLEAYHRMKNLGVRHLLVSRQGKTIGVISETNLIIALATQSKENPLMVADVAVSDFYSVGPDTPLSEVVEQMVHHRYSNVVVEDDDGEPLGIFTPVDACRVLAQILKHGR